MKKSFFYLISFIEGAVVMAAELLGAKMLAPFFGSSLYVWATVLAITLGGLAGGYFTGGMLSWKSRNEKLLYYVLLAAAVFTVLMPFTSKIILNLVSSQTLIFSIVLSTLLFLLPPVFMMGMVSPLIIRSVTLNPEEAGKMSGTIYAISTLGGIISTFLFGFFIIPRFGLTWPCIGSGILLSIIPLLVLLRKDIATVLFVLLVFSVCSYKAVKKKDASSIKVLYEKEGLLGQLLVVDYPEYNSVDHKLSYSRLLFNNRICQTRFQPSDTANPYLFYVNKLTGHLQKMKAGSNVLILGLGGGSLARELAKLHHVDACELDERVVSVAKDFFDLDPGVNIFIDDARHYIRNCKKTYDVVIFDVFKGEENPNHLITQESLEEVKKIMNRNALLVVNANGYWKGETGEGTRALAATLVQAWPSVKILPTGVSEESRNTLLFASENNLGYLADKNEISLAGAEQAIVLRDEYPVLDLLNYKANRAWRTGYIDNSIRYFQRNNIPLFR